VTAGLILAAGESRRMGSPKALLRYREETFLDTLIGRFRSRCPEVIVVLGAGAGAIRAGAVRPARFVVNLNWSAGMTTSLQCGLRAVPAEAAGVLFTLVDHPAVLPATVDALLSPARSASAPFRATPGIPLIRVPRYEGRRGHPIWFSRELIAELLALPETAAARDVVRRHAAETEFLDTDDPGILADIDDAEAYRKLTGSAV
jgi:molybdenum cofactor cytidylyltransferase